jgi:hypothetical protein
MTLPPWIPAADATRGKSPGYRPVHARLVLPRELVPVALLLLERPGITPDGLEMQLAALKAAGIATGSGLHPAAQATIAPLARPTTVLSIEILGPRPTISTIWIADCGATLGWSPDQMRLELMQVEPRFMPFYVAALVGLTVRVGDRLGGRAPISLPATHTNTGTDLGADLLVSPRRCRLTSLLRSTAGSTAEQTLEVIDGGRHGYWELSYIGAHDRIVLTPRSVDNIHRLIGDATGPC